MVEIKTRITFTEEVLGSANANPDIHKDFIASKAPNQSLKKEEVESIPEIDEEDEEKEEELSMTIFPKDKDNGDRPFAWNYQIRGFFKNAAKAMNYIGGSHKLKAYKTKIDDLVFVVERKIPYILPPGAEIGTCQRPLRASTAKGERVALACSETLPAGTQLEFTIRILSNSLRDNVIEWLDYGELNGLGQWHNSGKGTFTYEILDETKTKDE